MGAVTGLERRPWYRLANISNALREARRYPVLPIFVMMVVLVLPAILADLVAPFDPIKNDLGRRLQPPAWIGATIDTKTVTENRNSKAEISLSRARGLEEGMRVGQSPVLKGELAVGDQVDIVRTPPGSWDRPLGTDKLGRDILSRLIHGARVSLIVALAVIAIAGVVGTALGISAGYFGGTVDYLISRIVDITLSVPPILIAVVLAVIIGPGMKVVVAVVAGFLWARYARQMRGETLAIMPQDYIARARVAGASHIRIMVRHIFPNVSNTLIVLATLQVGFVILIEASLSFLGVGIPPPTPSWGVIVADGRDLIIQAGWWVSLFSGLAIMLTVLSVNLTGDWLRDKLDPKLRRV